MRNVMIFIIVADLGCLSRIQDPDFYPFRIPDPKSATKERGEKKLLVKPFFQCCGSGSFYNHAKIVRKTLIPTIL
jgi:hypothetical protein